MSKLTITPLTPDLWVEFTSLWHFSVNAIDPSIVQGYYSKSLWSYILLEGTTPIGAIGIYEIWTGVVECWLMSTERLSEYPVFMVKNFRRLTDALLTRGIHRVQMLVHNTPELNRWATLLGFTKEGVLHKYGADRKDNVIYAKV
jgi:hypothetical protein